jgi:hypothetical protein
MDRKRDGDVRDDSVTNSRRRSAGRRQSSAEA